MAISELIDKQDTFETVRDEIAAILATEVASQMALAVIAGKDPNDWKLRVFSERSNPWEQMLNDQTDRSPIVSVWFDSTSFNMASSNRVDRQTSEAVYNIDCYGFGFSADKVTGGHVAGDKEAALEVHRALRLVRNILMAAEYTYLNLRGLVWQRWPQAITAFEPEIDGRAMPNTAAARLALRVDFNEFSPQVPSETLELVSASVKRQETGEVVVEADYVYPLSQAFSTSDLPGLRVWLDADDPDTITESGGSVSQWDNKGDGLNFVQPFGFLQAITNATTLNGRNVLDFDNAFMSGGDFPLAGVDGLTVFIVAKIISEDFGMYFSKFLSNTDGTFYVAHSEATTGIFATNGGLGRVDNVQIGPWPLDTWFVITNKFDNSLLKTYKDGVLLSQTPQTSPLQTNTLDVIVGASAAGILNLKGSIAEIVACDSGLPDVIQQQEELLLKVKWGTP